MTTPSDSGRRFKLAIDQRSPEQRKADTVNEEMVRQMEVCRQALPERRRRVGTRPPILTERRRMCAFCHRPGDHRTPAECLQALEL